MIRKAKIADVKDIHALINHHAKKELMLARSLSELYENLRDFSVWEEGGRVVGCVALRIMWEDLCEVSSLAVAEEHQGKRIGSELVRICIEEARSLGVPRVFTLTFRPEFFEKLGFKRVGKERLPHKIWAECVRCPHFPDCDEIALVLDLSAEPTTQ
ncbi:MAG: N-acetyltransferase [Planctomycetes bacterium]|nr:N-acetyltransferase [Planctomycetota bacterium]